MHPIIKCILEYRNLYKLMSGYTDKLKSYILEDGKYIQYISKLLLEREDFLVYFLIYKIFL